MTEDERRARERANEAMERYADGEDGAFSDLYDELEPRLRRFALGLTGSEGAADDVIQQTMLQIHFSRARFVRGAPVMPWAYAIARNLIRDVGRHRTIEDKAVQALPEERAAMAAPLAPDELMDNKRREKALAEELRYLPESLRAAFVMVNVEGLSVPEVAEALGITPANVKVRAYRARRLLIETLKLEPC
jgi:RNA polymerase sigma-70 factor (ECF subfamily)